MSELILLDDELHEIGPVDMNVDFEIGAVTGTDSPALNDFQFTLPNDIDFHGMYIPSTEFGGVVEYNYRSSSAENVTYKGYSWRGLLDQSVISPPSGEDYRTVSGDANTIIKSLLADVLGGFFSVPDTASGCTISSYSFDRYCTVLAGLEKMLRTKGYRLYIHAEKEESGEPIKVYVEAVEAETASGTFDDDSPIPLTYTVNGMGYNHIIGMGQGDLKDRARVDKYLQPDGSVGDTQYYTGFDERMYYYDDSSAEDETVLASQSADKLLEIASGKTLGIESVSDELDLSVGDFVKGIFPDGTAVTASIKTVVKTISNGDETVTYTI